VWKVPQLVPFPETIERIAVGRRSCLALAESGELYIVDVDFTDIGTVTLQSPDAPRSFPSKQHSVLQMASGWEFSAVVIKGIGLMVWKSQVPAEQRIDVLENQTRNCKARLITRPELLDTDPANFDIVGLMVGDRYLVYLTKAGTVHRVKISDNSLSAPNPPTSFILTQFTAAPQLSYLSGSFYNFGLFNTAGDVLLGGIDTKPNSPPIIVDGLQHRGVISLAWGDWHTLALCEDGSILSWGEELRANGCLGMGYEDLEMAMGMGLNVVLNKVSCPEPRKIKGFGGDEEKFAFCVAAGGWQSAALVADC
jgi:SCF-associated factor 1